MQKSDVRFVCPIRALQSYNGALIEYRVPICRPNSHYRVKGNTGNLRVNSTVRHFTPNNKDLKSCNFEKNLRKAESYPIDRPLPEVHFYISPKKSPQPLSEGSKWQYLRNCRFFVTNDDQVHVCLQSNVL
ncbi:hypothetical protein AVEN_224088-1 [Araneus ventricosus]|uniref:Uncharacterized protein n=1 Tax=Araneus ventricosus TaxID=182803 RepID=A0A4Y2TM25_ARAVE|nr:hypothetical protein AVEN_224088-1 [Araneus ventricosus]